MSTKLLDVQNVITAKLEKGLAENYGFSAQRANGTLHVVAVKNRSAAHFFGELLVSALQTTPFLEAVCAGELLVWAIVIDGKPYGLGVQVGDDGSLVACQKSFGFLNSSDSVTEEIDALLASVLTEINA